MGNTGKHTKKPTREPLGSKIKKLFSKPEKTSVRESAGGSFDEFPEETASHVGRSENSPGKKRRKKNSVLWQLRWYILLIAEVALVLAVIKIIRYNKETNASEAANEELRAAVTMNDPISFYPDFSGSGTAGWSAEEPTDNGEDGSEAVSMEKSAAEDPNFFPIKVDFDLLLSKNPDCVGWLYSKDTPISLAVLQAEDNTYYLFRTFDRINNGYGTIFMDCRNSSTFSDATNLIFGHNMINETMFGSLRNYREQEYFEAHPYLWLATPNKNYRLDVVAGFVHEDSSILYYTPISRSATNILIPDAIQNSVFSTDAVYDPSAKYVVLSTCCYDYEGSRLGIVCKMVEMN